LRLTKWSKDPIFYNNTRAGVLGASRITLIYGGVVRKGLMGQCECSDAEGGRSSYSGYDGVGSISILELDLLMVADALA